MSTKLGWIISGTTNLESQNSSPVVVNHLSVNTDNLVKSFWELEFIPNSSPLTREEKLCEIRFEEHRTRDNNGRYSVMLPFKPNRKVLGDSREAALRRFLYLEKRLSSMPKIYSQYKEFMREYLSLGHMELILSIDSNVENQHYYIPHHFVINESSLTTKLRVVFDASAKTSSGVSLNDVLMNGPKTQEDLICILLRFRFHNIAVTADIKMMYRQVNIHPEDRDFQRIFWRDSRENKIQTFCLNTVTYGTTSAPYLATRVLKQLALDEKVNFPKTADITLRDFYGDEALTSANDIQEATELVIELQEILRKGGFELHKWSTNEKSVLENALMKSSDNKVSQTSVENKAIKVLGLVWHPSVDEFTCNIPDIEFQNKDIRTKHCASRGLLPSDLVDHELWWSGPKWLMTSDIPFPTDVPNCQEALKEERKQTSCAVGLSVEELPIISRVSSFRKLQRVLAWCLRLISNAKLTSTERKFGALTTKELEKGLVCCIKQVQVINFASELKCLQSGKPLPANSRILNLYPFIDND
ncbi:retrovirus-related Pol polyprotein from transposon 17.6, partial [Trichonephila clavata]